MISKKNRIARTVAVIPVVCIGLILIMLMTLWFTDVNGIRFGTVISFLYQAMQSGVF